MTSSRAGADLRGSAYVHTIHDEPRAAGGADEDGAGEAGGREGIRLHRLTGPGGDLLV